MILKLTHSVPFENNCVKFCMSLFATKVAPFYITFTLLIRFCGRVGCFLLVT